MKWKHKALILNLLPILTALLIDASYISFPAWALLFGLTPLWFSWLLDPRPLPVFFRGWLAQFGFMIISEHWVYQVARDFGHLPIPFSIAILILYAATACLYFPVAGLLWSLLQRQCQFSPTFSLWLMASFTYLFETIFPAIFPWNLGYPWFSGNLPAFQWADVIGITGLSFLTYAFNAAFAIGWVNRKFPVRFVSIYLGILITFIALQWSGAYHVAQYRKTAILKHPIHVLVVQANIGNNEKILSEKYPHWKESVLTTYLTLTQQGLRLYPNTDLIIWPETAFPRALNLPSNNDKAVRRLLNTVRNMQKPLLTGGYFEDEKNDAMYNAAFLINHEGNVVSNYRKTILLIFGEYIPFASLFPALKNVVPEISNFGRGDEVGLIPFQQTKMGMQICYEGIYPYLTRKLSLQGANWIVNITNDSWFGGGLEAKQHLLMTLARAVEVRMPLVRATNTGISTVINADGSYEVMSPFGKVWFNRFTIDIVDNPLLTFYTQYGYYFPLFILIITLLSIIWNLRRKYFQ